jgi:hypothetical protein
MAVQKLEIEGLPPEVLAAYQAADAWLADRFAGRRLIPTPFIVSLPIPEEGEGAALYAVLVPPGGEGRKRIERLGLSCASAREKGGEALAEALAKVNEAAILETCFWVGIPAREGAEALAQEEEGKGARSDPRVRARDFLRKLQDEPGSLASAFAEVADQVAKMLAAPGASLGKL